MPWSWSRRLLIFGGAALASGVAAQAPKLRLLSEDFPPVNFEHQGRPSGMAGELVMALQQRLNLSAPVEFMPWSRAYSLAQSQDAICLFTMARASHREKLFKWVGPVVEFQNALFARQDLAPGLKLKRLEDAALAPTILVVRDWASAQELQRRGFQNLMEISQGEKALRMLMAGRAPLLAAELLTLPDLLKREGLPPDAIQIVHTYTGSLGYLAFSLATPDEEVQRWQQALDGMKRDGSYARIFKRWLPHMTPP